MDYTSILEQHQALVNAVQQSMAQQAAEQARKQAEFQSLKNSVDKVFFAYTLQRASDEKLTEWTQYLSGGVSVDTVVSIMRSDNSSMYFGAGREASINNAFITLFGRSPTAGETARYSSVDTALIPGLVALEASGSDAETMYLRLHGSQAIKDYYQATNIPLTYGMPAMKAKEQLLTLKAGADAQDLVSDAVREMGDFLAEWGRVINKPGNAAEDIEPPKREYFYTDADTVGVAFYEPPTGTSKGRILVTFDEPVDWSAMDHNRDGRLELFSELDIISSNPRIFGDNPTVTTRIGVNSLVINIGSNAATPLFSGKGSADDFVLGDTITFVSVSDYSGNSGAALFAVSANASTINPDEIIPTEYVPPSASSITRVGDRLLLAFDEPLFWRAWDKDGDGRIVVDADNNGSLQNSAEMQILTSRTGMIGVGAVIENYSSKQMTLYLGRGHNYIAGDQLVTVGTMDLSGNTASVLFAEPVPTAVPTSPADVDLTPPSAASIERVGDRLLLSFSEKLEWRSWDANGDGKISLDVDNDGALSGGKEMQILSSRLGLFGSNAIVESYSNNQMTVHLGTGHTYRNSDQLVAVRATDLASNSANVLFTEGGAVVEVIDITPPAAQESKSIGDRLFLTFTEAIDWAKLDTNGDKQITLGLQGTTGREGYFQAASAQALGDSPVIESYSSNQAVIRIGANSTYDPGDDIVLMNILDLTGNMAHVKFAEPDTGASVVPVPSPVTRNLAVFVGDKTAPAAGNQVIMEFNQNINWGLLDKNADGVISVSYLPGTGVPLANAELTIYTPEPTMLGSTVTVVSAYSNQITLQLGVGNSYGPRVDLNNDGDVNDPGESADIDDDVMIVGVTDMFGNMINGVFGSPFLP
jgi:hypothetical protein